MIVSTGKSRCQVKRINGVDYCLNIMTGHGDPMELIDVYDYIIPHQVKKTLSSFTAYPNGYSWTDSNGGGGGGSMPRSGAFRVDKDWW